MTPPLPTKAWGARALFRLRALVRPRPATAEPEAAAALAATMARRCAALLRGGTAPQHALHSAATEAAGETGQLIAEALGNGTRAPQALAEAGGPEWRVLGAAWALAEASGAPFAPALDRIADALDSIAESARKRSVLLAGPALTGRLVTWLPLAAMGVGFLLGFDPLAVFFTPVGAMLLTVGLLLQGAGMRWTRALVMRVERGDRIAGLECELAWIALSGGAPPGSAAGRVADAISECRAEWVEFDALRTGGVLDRTLRAAASAGVPAGTMLLGEARAVRSRVHAEIEREAERLGVRILVPLACCVLPAFITLGVVPVIITLLGDVMMTG